MVNVCLTVDGDVHTNDTHQQHTHTHTCTTDEFMLINTLSVTSEHSGRIQT